MRWRKQHEARDPGRERGFVYGGAAGSVELAQRQAEQGTPCVMLGSIIHNSHVVERLASQGIQQIDTPEQAPPGATC